MSKQPMQASGQESKGAHQPDGVNDRAEDGQAGEGSHYQNPHDRKTETQSHFFGHGGQTHLEDRSNSGKQIDETDTD